MPSPQAAIKPWLAQNGYDDILKLIREVEAEWKQRGKRTRRNWWEILAGDKHGQPRKVWGRTFPALATAQERQNMPVTPNARRSPGELAPPAIRVTGRWPIGGGD